MIVMQGLAAPEPVVEAPIVVPTQARFVGMAIGGAIGASLGAVAARQGMRAGFGRLFAIGLVGLILAPVPTAAAIGTYVAMGGGKGKRR